MNFASEFAGFRREASACRVRDFGGDRVERVAQVRAKLGEREDERDGDEGGDQAIFDGGRAVFVFDKFANELRHVSSLQIPGSDRSNLSHDCKRKVNAAIFYSATSNSNSPPDFRSNIP